MKDIQTIRETALPILRDSGVLRASLFGSVARGDAGAESDIDILVEFPRGKTLLDMAELRFRLEEALGSRVDITTYRSLARGIRETALREQVSVL